MDSYRPELEHRALCIECAVQSFSLEKSRVKAKMREGAFLLSVAKPSPRDPEMASTEAVAGVSSH